MTPWGHGNDPLACTNSAQFIGQTVPNPSPLNVGLTPNPSLPPTLDRVCSYNATTGKLDPNGTVTGPPPLGSFLFPVAVAADGQAIFVSDKYNGRVQAFLFDGTPIPATTPMGNATVGTGASQLVGPEGLAIARDLNGNHVLAVADAYNHRVAFFNVNQTTTNGVVTAVDGSPAFHYPVVDSVNTAPSDPFTAQLSGIAMSPGTTILGIGVSAGTDSHRIVVTDRGNCSLYILDAGLNLIAQVPPVPPSGDPVAQFFDQGQGSCVQGPAADPMAPPTPPLGYFASATGVAVDAAGHIFVADYENSRIQILDPNGVPLTSFGTPPDPSTLPPGAPVPPGTLQNPWAVAIDHLGRIIVTDSDNERIAFFKADFSTTPPTVVFQFQLNAAGSLNGNPTGVAEQVGPDTDPAGRLVVANNARQEIQRFQLPDLAITKVNISQTAAIGNGTYDVVVPFQKQAPVTNVSSTVQSVAVSTATVNGVPTTIVTPNSNATIQSGPLPSLPAPIDIPPGAAATYSFGYGVNAKPVIFALDATGNAGATKAPEAVVAPVEVCTDCATVAVVLSALDQSTPAPISNGWYNQIVVVNITATSTNPQGLAAIAYQFTSGPEVQDYGGAVHLVNASNAAGSANVSITRTGASVMQYWAINADGSSEAHHNLNLWIDTAPPGVSLGFPQPDGKDAAGNPWYRKPISVSVKWTDDLSGPATPDSSLAFSAEKRDQFTTIQGVDRAGNSSLPRRTDQGSGGQPVNIDFGWPTFTGLPASVTLELTGPHVGAVVAGGAADLLFQAWHANPSLVASDPNLADGSAGSGVVSIAGLPAAGDTFPMNGGGPTSTPKTITVTDGAGNSSLPQMLNIIVQDTTPPQLLCPAAVAVPLSGVLGVVKAALPDLTKFATSSDLSGTVTLGQSIAAGALLGLGTQDVNVTSTDPSGNSSSCPIAVTVKDTTPPVITVPDQTIFSSGGANNAVVNYVVAAQDNVTTPQTVSCTPASGSTFPLGTTTVSCTATDAAGNQATRSFVISVVTAVPPKIVQADISVAATSPQGAAVAFAPTVTDQYDSHPTVVCTRTPGSTFAIGTTAVTCTASNRFGLSASVTFAVTVRHSAPDCTSAAPDIAVLWPPNHKLVSIAITRLKNADGSAISTAVKSIFQDEPTGGLGDGDTAIDGFGVGTSTAQVRAERSGTGDGRFYYIGFTATTAGGSCSATVSVGVPHDQAHAPVGQGPLYDSTKP